MTRRQVMRLVSAVLGGVAVALAFLAGLLVLNSGSDLVGSTAATAAGWMIPMLAGVVAGGVAWALLMEDGAGTRADVVLGGRCPDCGRSLAEEWRLCPYCGAMTHVESGVPLSPAEEIPL